MDDETVVLKRKLDESPDDEGLQIRYHAALDRTDKKVRKRDDRGEWIAWTPRAGVLARIVHSCVIELSSRDFLDFEKYESKELSNRLHTPDFYSEILSYTWEDSYSPRTLDVIAFDGVVSRDQAQAWIVAEQYSQATVKELVTLLGSCDWPQGFSGSLYGLGSIRHGLVPKRDERNNIVVDAERDVIHQKGDITLRLYCHDCTVAEHGRFSFEEVLLPDQFTTSDRLCVYRPGC